jgi:hypothetical protein
LDSEENTKHAMPTRKTKQISGCCGMDSTETLTRNQLQQIRGNAGPKTATKPEEIRRGDALKPELWKSRATSATTDVAGRQ